MQVGASDGAVRDHMGKLRGNVRTHVGKLQRTATSSIPAAAAPRAHAHQPAAGVVWQPSAARMPHAQLIPPTVPTQPNVSRLAVVGSIAAPPAQCSSALPGQLPRPQEAASASRSILTEPAAQAGLPGQQSAVHSQPAPMAGDTCAAAASAQGPGPGSLAQQSSTAAHQHGGRPSQPAPAPNCTAQPPGLDLSKLQQILQNAFPSQSAHPAQAGTAPSTAAAAAPSLAPPGQVSQPIQDRAAGAGVLQSSSSLAQAAVPPSPKAISKLEQGFGLPSPDEGAAALAAVDKAYAQDTATLDLLLDARRNVRPECAGEQLTRTEVYGLQLRRAA